MTFSMWHKGETLKPFFWRYTFLCRTLSLLQRLLFRCFLLSSYSLSFFILHGSLTEFGMLVSFTNLGIMEFQVRYLALFLLFPVIGGFRWFRMGSLHRNIQLMLKFLKGPFLALHFSYYTLMTFLIMLSVILLSMLMIIPLL